MTKQTLSHRVFGPNDETNPAHYDISHNANGVILFHLNDGKDESHAMVTIAEAEEMIKLLFENVVRARILKEKKRVF